MLTAQAKEDFKQFIERIISYAVVTVNGKEEKKVIKTKRHPTEWEKNLPATCPIKGGYSDFITNSKKLHIKKTYNSILKWDTDLNRKFSKIELQMSEKHLKKCSASLVIRKITNQNKFEILSYTYQNG